MKKPEMKTPMRKEILRWIEKHPHLIQKWIKEESMDIRIYLSVGASLSADNENIEIRDFYEDLQDYEDDVKEIYEEIAKKKKVRVLFFNDRVEEVFLDGQDWEFYAKNDLKETKAVKEIAEREETVKVAVASLWEVNPSLNESELLGRAEEYTGKAENYIRKLYEESLKNGGVASWVLLNFRPSKLRKPVNDWTDAEWKAELDKFAAFRTAIISDGTKADDLDLDDQNKWTELHQELAKKLLEGRVTL